MLIPLLQLELIVATIIINTTRTTNTTTVTTITMSGMKGKGIKVTITRV